MFDRRNFLGSAAALGMLGTTARAQVPDNRPYGAPARTSPFPPEVYRERRQRLMDRMKTGVAVIYGATSIDGSSTVAGVNRQDPDFAYLTGIMDEPGAALVLAPGERTFKEFLFLARRDPDMERYEGEQLNIGEEARARTGFQKIYRSNWLGTIVTALTSRAGELRYVGGLVPPESPVPAALDLYGKVSARVPGTRITNNQGMIAAMRVAKEPREIAAMR